MTKSKELKTKISHAHSLILSPIYCLPASQVGQSESSVLLQVFILYVGLQQEGHCHEHEDTKSFVYMPNSWVDQGGGFISYRTLSSYTLFVCGFCYICAVSLLHEWLWWTDVVSIGLCRGFYV